MPRSVRWKGRSIYRPGVYTYHDLSGLVNLDLGAEASIMIIGEGEAGEPQAAASSPVYHTFTSSQDMIDTFIGGNLAEVARFAFDPLLSGQEEDGVPLRGCDKVYVIKTNQSTQGEYTLTDGANDALKLKGRLWGARDNQTWFILEVSGSGLQLTIGRDVEPNVGSQVSETLFSITGVDEWFSVTYTGAAATCVMDFDGTTFTTTTAAAVDDLSITATGKTVNEVVNEINAAASGDYTAAVLRQARSNTLFTYADRFAAVNIKALVANQMGVAYDIVAWVNANSAYCEAEWIGGYEPQAYTQTWLAGGTQGESTSTTIQEALKTAKKINCRFIASAISDDVGAGGAVTLQTVNGYFDTHLNQVNPVTGRAERQAFGCENATTKATLWSNLAALNQEFLSICQDNIQREDENGTVGFLGPHCMAVACAAAMAGSPIGTPLTFKYLRGYDHTPVATDFDPGDDSDYAAAINAGLLFLETDPGVGIRVAKGISTYKTEDNDGRIMLEVVEERLWMARILRRNLERPFIGHKGRGIRTVNQVRGRVLDIFRQFADTNSPDQILISGTDALGNEVPPFRNVRVWLSGDQIYVYAEITFAQGVDWILNDFRATMPSALAA